MHRQVIGVGFAAAFAIGGCNDPVAPDRHLEVGFENTNPIGVGLTAELYFSLRECDGRFATNTCSNPLRITAETFEITTEDENARVVASSLDCRANCQVVARVMGLAAGTTRVRVAINDFGPIEIRIDIRNVRSTFIRPLAILVASDFFERSYTEGESSAFSRSSILVEQQHYSGDAPDSERPAEAFELRGSAPWRLSNQLVSFDPELRDPDSSIVSLDIGSELGTAEIGTEMGGRLGLQIVDRAAISSLEIVALGFSSPIEELVLSQGQGFFVRLVPLDSMGQMIFGAGERPTLVVREAVVDVSPPPGDAYELVYGITAKNPGSDTLEFSFGDVGAGVSVVVE